MNFQSIITNWKTSLGGVILLGLSAAQMVGVVIPGIPHLDFGTTLVSFIGGLTALVASDATAAK